MKPDLEPSARRRLRKSPPPEGEAASDDPRRLVHELQVHQAELEIQNVELCRSAEELERTRARYADLYDHAPVGYFTLDSDAVVLAANRKGADLLGKEGARVLGARFGSLIAEEDRPGFARLLARLFAGGEPERCEVVLDLGNARSLPILLEASISGPGRECHVAVSDVAELARARREAETASEFLRIVNESDDLTGLLRALTGFIQARTGCEAVGVRLQRGDDFPYCETRGFSEEFVLAETSLCSRDEEGLVLRDDAGAPALECMCGNVIRGRFDPSLPFFTAGGSFWSNGTTRLLASTTDADRQARTRNHCNGEGYESVALIPLRSGRGNLGLLQLNDRREGRFTPETVALWERLAGYLAVTVAKLEADEALRRSEERLRLALEGAHMGSWEWDVTTQRSVWNAREYELLGLAAGDGSVETDLFFRHVHPADADALRNGLETLMSEGTDWEGEFRTVGADGATRWLAGVGRLVRDSEGRPLRMLGVNYDVTDRKRAEEETAGLLAQTRRDADHKGRLLDEINHRVKNNLLSLLGLLMAETKRPEPGSLPSIQATVEALSDRVRGMLVAHDLLCATGWAPVPVAELCERVVRQRVSAGGVGRRVLLVVAPSEVKVSPRQVNSVALVLNELATNTLKHAAPHRERVTVSLRVLEGEEFATLEYRDDGPGYPAAVLAGEFPSVGLALASKLAAGTLRGGLTLSNDGGAVASLRLRTEDLTTT